LLGYYRVLEKRFEGPENPGHVLEFFVSKRMGTLANGQSCFVAKKLTIAQKSNMEINVCHHHHEPSSWAVFIISACLTGES